MSHETQFPAFETLTEASNRYGKSGSSIMHKTFVVREEAKIKYVIWFFLFNTSNQSNTSCQHRRTVPKTTILYFYYN